MEGAPARAAAKRRPFRDLEVGRQIRSFTYHFAKREIRDRHGLSRPGPTSSPNGRGAGGLERFL